jgi:hypothetical protein
MNHYLHCGVLDDAHSSSLLKQEVQLVSNVSHLEKELQIPEFESKVTHSQDGFGSQISAKHPSTDVVICFQLNCI